MKVVDYRRAVIRHREKLLIGEPSNEPQMPNLPSFFKTASFMNNGPIDPMEVMIDRVHFSKVNTSILIDLYSKELRNR